MKRDGRRTYLAGLADLERVVCVACVYGSAGCTDSYNVSLYCFFPAAVSVSASASASFPHAFQWQRLPSDTCQGRADRERGTIPCLLYIPSPVPYSSLLTPSLGPPGINSPRNPTPRYQTENVPAPKASASGSSTLEKFSWLFSALPPETTRGADERSGRVEMVSSSERDWVGPVALALL